MRAAGSAGLMAVLALSGCTLDLVDVDVAEEVASTSFFTLDIAERTEAPGGVDARFGASLDPGSVGDVPRVITDRSLSIGSEQYQPAAVNGRVLLWPLGSTLTGARAGAVEVVMPAVAGLSRTTFTTASLLDDLAPGPVRPDESGDWVFTLTVHPPQGPAFVRTGARWSIAFRGADRGVRLLSLEGLGVPSSAVRVSPGSLPPGHPSDVVAVVRMEVTYEAESEAEDQRVWLAVSKEVSRPVSLGEVGRGDG